MLLKLLNSSQILQLDYSKLNQSTYWKQKFIASENRLCYLFALTACRKLNELFVQFDNVRTACQFHNAILDSLNCLNDALSSGASANTIYN